MCKSQLHIISKKCVQRWELRLKLAVKNPVFTSSSTPVFWRSIHSLSFSLLHQLIDSSLLQIDPLILSVFTRSWLQSSADRSTLDKWDTRRRGRGWRILAVAWIRIIIIYGKNAFLELNKSVSVATIIQVNTGFYPTPSWKRKKMKNHHARTHASRGALITSAGYFVSL
jgi:hypothetical protein